MKSTGIVRGIDSLGRIVLPKELRTNLGITAESKLEIFTEGDTILLKKYSAADTCALCGELNNLITMHNTDPNFPKTVHLCPDCLEQFKQAMLELAHQMHERDAKAGAEGDAEAEA